jgi:8-oxo-dGTP diphosphatase
MTDTAIESSYAVVMIEAAGGVIWREIASEHVEVLVIHRPRYRDWSLPKGKLKRGESHLDCALREVHEETGLHCQVGPELATAHYIDRKQRPKRVRYWAMQAQSGRFRSNDEVDAVQWVPHGDAPGVLSYEHDIVVVSGLHVVMAQTG